MYTFVETKLFTRLVQDYLTDDEYGELQSILVRDPDTGVVIPGSGGVRKLRWRATHRAKRGGYRVIYFTKTEEGLIYMLTLYPKNVKATIPAGALRKIRKEVEDA